MLDQHPHAAAVLGAALDGRPAHAYLLHGPAGTGKRAAARDFAAALLARDDPESAPHARPARHASRPHVGRAERRARDAAARRAGVGGVRRLAHAVRVHPPRVRARARRHHERRGGQRAAQDARGAAALRRPAAADRQPVAGAADDQLALPAGALRPAARRRARADGSSRAGSTPRPPPPARGSRSATASERSTLALSPELRARTEAFARAPLHGRAHAEQAWRPLLDQARGAGAAAKREVEAALAEELQYLPKKEHRKRETEFTDRARRAERRASTGALEHALQLVGLWYRDLACVVGRRRGARPPQRPARPAARGRRQARRRRLARGGRARSTTRAPPLALNVSEELALEALAYRLES